MFYKIDSTAVTLHEYWWGNKNPLHFLIAGMCKLFRVQISSSVDDPNVETLQPFQVAEEALPETVRSAFAPLAQEMGALGFHSPVFHAIEDGFHMVKIYQATYASADGTAFGRIHLRLWEKPHPPRRAQFPMFVTCFSDHTFLISTGGKPDMHAPASCRLNRIHKADATTLWHSHQQALAEMAKPYHSIAGSDGLMWAIDAFHAEVRDFHLKRGVFKAMSGAEESQGAATREFMANASASGLQRAEVLVELDRRQKGKGGSWLNIILILLVSMIVFVGAEASAWSWDYVLLLIPILLFHEAGHYLAMRIFHYKNLRMFFIPLFGAAVSGKNYNVPGWKKVVVSLMGPVPGIGLGIIIGLIGVLLHRALLMKLALLMLILNAINLLPLLPLDGGWVMHAIFFSRHYLLDTGFRLLAGIGLIAVSAFLKTKSLFYVGLVTLISLPVSFKLARIAGRLQAQGISPASPDDQTVPTGTAQSIITEIKKDFPKGVTNRLIATNTLQVFETLNAKPPSWPVSILFLGVHGFSVLAAIVFSIFFVIQQNPMIGSLIGQAAFMPRIRYVCGSSQVWRGPKSDANEYATVLATFKTQDEAEQTFAASRDMMPETGALETYGRTLFVRLPAVDETGRKKWFSAMQLKTTNVFVDNTNFTAAVSLMCIAKSDADAKRIEEEFRDYASLAQMYVTPPWRTPGSPSDVGQQTHRARVMYKKLRMLGVSGVRNDSEMKNIEHKMQEAERQGDSAELGRLVKEERRIRDEAEQRALQKLRNEAADGVEKEMVELYTQCSTNSPTNEIYGKLQLEMGARMGQLPLENGRPTAESAKEALRWGSVMRTGLVLRFNYISFHEVFDGLPAMTEWLCKQGCIGFKYSIQGEAMGESGDDGPD